MKRRIQVDNAILSFIIILTGFLYHFPRLYSHNRFIDNGMDFLGFFLILVGTYIRMAARGYKKANSRKGVELVTDGIYALIRHPMYLGSLLMGAGFILIVWPWWTLLIFIALFYLRFNPQMVKEEDHLRAFFGKNFEKYCASVPRLFPSPDGVAHIRARKVFSWKEAWDTKEKRGLLGWPLLAIFLETLQENIVFGGTSVAQTSMIYLAALGVFIVIFWFYYRNP